MLEIIEVLLCLFLVSSCSQASSFNTAPMSSDDSHKMENESFPQACCS